MKDSSTFLKLFDLLIGFECKVMKFDDHEEVAKELLTKMKAKSKVGMG